MSTAPSPTTLDAAPAWENGYSKISDCEFSTYGPSNNPKACVFVMPEKLNYKLVSIVSKLGEDRTSQIRLAAIGDPSKVTSIVEAHYKEWIVKGFNPPSPKEFELKKPDRRMDL